MFFILLLLHVRALIHVMGANVDVVTNNFIETYGTRSNQKLIASSIQVKGLRHNFATFRKYCLLNRFDFTYSL